MSTNRYIEINSTYRNRLKYPCPGEFVIPISCNNSDNPLDIEDPIVEAYPLFSWYQIPYATSIKELNGITCSDPCIRKINGIHYTSLWPLNINLTDDDSAIGMKGVLNAMKFAGGTPGNPVLNTNLVYPPNKWSVPDPAIPNNRNSILNPYFLPIKNYLAGAMLLRFKINPSISLNLSEFNGYVESSIIKSYDEGTGSVSLTTPFSNDFDSSNDWFLIDFNTDPSNTWSEYVGGGPRIFIPGGVNRIDAYKGLYIKNFTSSMSCNKNNMFSKIIGYDNIRKIAYLENNIDIIQQNENFQYDSLTPSSPSFLFGSNTYVIVKNLPLISRSFMEHKIAINNGSILKLSIICQGISYKIGEIIGSTNINNNDYYEPFYDDSGNIVEIKPDYIIMNSSGLGFIGRISEVDANGHILDIETIQQGYNYKLQNFNIKGIGNSQGNGAVLNIPSIYQTIEISKRNDCDGNIIPTIGDFLYLPLLGQNSKSDNKTPNIPRYSYTPVIQPGTTTEPYTSSFDLLDIKTSEFPPSILCDDLQIEIGTRQIAGYFVKNNTFNCFWKDTINIGPITVIFLKTPFCINELGKSDIGESIYEECGFNSGYLINQIIEILPFSRDNEFPLNYTGSTVSQTQMVCYEISLISLILPNLPLNNTIGGIIAFYPYVYVEFSNYINPNGGNKNIIYSNNPNANKALFKVSIQDTNNPDKTAFIKLRGEGTQTVKFTPNDYLYFRVILNDGTLFQTGRQDNSPPLPPDFFVQISAEFEIRRL